jgi:hypothetical protein
MVLALINALGSGSYHEFSIADTTNQHSSPLWTQKTKISAPQSQICAVLLTWSGLQDLWHDHDLGDTHSFFNDVVMLCDGVKVDVEHQDESPLADDSFTILIHDPQVARGQMAEAVYGLVTERLEGRSASKTVAD